MWCDQAKSTICKTTFLQKSIKIGRSIISSKDMICWKDAKKQNKTKQKKLVFLAVSQTNVSHFWLIWVDHITKG